MGIQSRRLSVAALVVLLGGFGMVGCAGPATVACSSQGRTGNQCEQTVTPPASAAGTATPTSTTAATSGTDGGSSGVIAPIMVDLAHTAGAVVMVGLNNVVVLNAGDTKVTSWTASIGDPTIASFTPGKADGSATFNPGLKPLRVGATTVTLTNTDTSFTTLIDLVVTSE